MGAGWKKTTAWVNSSQADKVADYYAEGHSVKETAELFGVSAAQVSNLARTRKISNGRSATSGLARANAMRAAKAEERTAELLREYGLEYLGGYTNKEGKVRVKCLRCDSEYERTLDFLKKGTAPVCSECQAREAQARQEERRRKAKQQAEVRRLEREWYRRFHPPKNHYTEMHEVLLNRAGVCAVCGKEYTVREYAEACGTRYAVDNGVCSAECKRIKQRRNERKSRRRRGIRDTHRHRARKYGCEYDPSVTLQKLVERDGLRCAICGGMCDWNDHSWSEYSGPTYPSIDHIIPMSKGGGHVWENVQVAHIICNSYKGDTQEAV